MFLGHFGIAFAVKRVAPEVSLGTTILAAEFLDAVWPVLVLAGIERVEIVPGITRVTPLDFVHYPWSHSLLMAFAWAALFAAAYWALRRRTGAALWLGLVVVSHWFLDWAVHRPDLPLYPGDPMRHGMSLWNSIPVTLALELGLFAAGIFLYLRTTRALDRFGTYALWGFVAFLLASYAGAVFGPPPPSVEAIAYTGVIGFLLMIWGGWIVDRHRRSEPTR